ncbi:MAG: glycosyltransferase [Calditrichota bacterium]
MLDQETMRLAYHAADLVVARAGAMTLAELAMAGRGAILVPYPFAAGNHQEANARSVEKAGAAKVILDSDFNPDSLLKAIDDLRAQNQISQLAEASSRLAKPQAVKEIVDDIWAELNA